jgi:hypothetical protein
MRIYVTDVSEPVGVIASNYLILISFVHERELATDS